MLKRWRNSKWFKIVSNRYVLATFFFAIWMLFLDRHNLGLHIELSQQIEEYEEARSYYQEELERNTRELEELESDPAKLEKFAREKYWMHKEGEEVFLISTEEE
ncbi:MAG: septum formation initiator family protein [Flavobacteriia bacterium]|nr:septum formation initiator family protein [Flavobacteriia bacterium]